MPELKLIYFKGCPNAKKASRMLSGAGFEFSPVCQDDLPPNHPLRGYSSPTILREDEIIFGSRTTGDSGGCSLDVHALEDILECLKRA